MVARAASGHGPLRHGRARRSLVDVWARLLYSVDFYCQTVAELSVQHKQQCFAAAAGRHPCLIFIF